MKDIFEGLEGLGLDDLDQVVLFENENKMEDKELIRQQQIEITKDILFERKGECPICDMRFTSQAVKSGKLKLIDSDSDLRPIYDKLDPLLYDVMVCPTCGYASLAKTFKYVKESLVPAFKEKVSTKYKSKEYPTIYTYDIAIEQYKLALYSGMILSVSNCEKAYICLKLAWLYRGKCEELGQVEPEVKRELAEYEMTFLTQAYEGFKLSIDKETFPQLGIDALTVKYIIGELARRLGHLDEAFEVMRKLSISNKITHRLKLRVTAAKEKIIEQVSQNKEGIDKDNKKTSES